MKKVTDLSDISAEVATSLPPFRLRLVYSDSRQEPVHSKQSKSIIADSKKSSKLELLATVFARELSNPVAGLFASLQFALKDLASISLHNSASKRKVDLLLVEQTIHGALREVTHLAELLDDFRASLPYGSRKKTKALRSVRLVKSFAPQPE